MQYRKNVIVSVIMRWLALILIIALICLIAVFYSRPMIFEYAKSYSKSFLLNTANRAVIEIINEENITYNKISRVSRNETGQITGIEIDTEKINLLKSKIASRISEIAEQTEFHDLKIPLGTFLKNEYTTGFGPKITMRMQISPYVSVDFESKFTDAGINQTLHQILIRIDGSATMLLLGTYCTGSVSTSAIAAQTVIVGEIPENFTNVVESPGDDIADEIFNYADLE